MRATILKPYKLPNGYCRVDLRHNNEIRRAYVHRVVAETFLPNPLNKAAVNHKDGVRNNNNVLNLEWTTDAENTNHAITLRNKQGKRWAGGMRRCLTDEQVRTIRTRVLNGETRRAVAADLGVCYTVICRICKWQLYKDVV